MNTDSSGNPAIYGYGRSLMGLLGINLPNLGLLDHEVYSKKFKFSTKTIHFEMQIFASMLFNGL